MGLSVAVVKGRLFHGRKKLHQVLKRQSAGMSGETLKVDRSSKLKF